MEIQIWYKYHRMTILRRSLLFLIMPLCFYEIRKLCRENTLVHHIERSQVWPTFQAAFSGIVWCGKYSTQSVHVVCSEARLQLRAWRSPCLQSARNPSDPSHIWFWISFGSLHFQTFLLLPILFAASFPPFSCVTPYGVASLSLRSWGVDREGGTD